MTNPLLTRSQAAAQALEVLVDKQAKGIPAHFQSQVAALRRDLNRLKTALASGAFRVVEVARIYPETAKEFMEGTPAPGDEDFVRSPELEAELVSDVARYMEALVKRLITGPIKKPELAAAAVELEALVADLNTEAQNMWAEIDRVPDEGPDGTWPAGINPDDDDLDLGRKE